jgi:chromosome segregation ATPase
VRELKARETEADNAKRREGALRVVLSRAIQQGYVVEEDHAIDPPSADAIGDNEAVRQVATALVRLKQEKANLQNDVANQMKIANDRIQDAERLQKSTLQETAYYRAKAIALESGSGADLKRIEAERIVELERQLESQTGEYEGNRIELERIQAELVRHTDLSSSATEREAETLKRAEEAEEENARLAEELEELRERSTANDKQIRDHTERFIALTSTQQQREAERDDYKTQLNDAFAKHAEYLIVIEQAQASLTSAGTRSVELETLHGKTQEQVGQLEAELVQVRRELEDKTREAEQAQQRLAEAETLHNTTREEASNLRTLNTGNLSELLVLHRGAKDTDERAVKGHQDQLRALEEEKSSLLKLLREAGQRVDATDIAVNTHRQKTRELETSHQSLRSDLRLQRTKLLSVQTEVSKYRDLYAAKDSELRDRDQAVTELQTRVSLLRKMMGDHGIVVTDNQLDNAELPSTSELETKLRDKTRAHENSQREIEELTARVREAEEKSESLGRHVERINNRSGSSASMRSPSPGGASASEARALEAERKLQEIEEKLSVVESDYQTAVRYVKGTEKMLNRLKVGNE